MQLARRCRDSMHHHNRNRNKHQCRVPAHIESLGKQPLTLILTVRRCRRRETERRGPTITGQHWALGSHRARLQQHIDTIVIDHPCSVILEPPVPVPVPRPFLPE
mmetsp:Transcript_76641/g.177810  ORF Transcript_76641/g.177810 Transcript_76641/m.177810 type:complete len:105 (-) Transcript_76641:330-644(-)